MIRTWDFKCKTCNTAYKSYPCEGKIPQAIDCTQCGGKATWASFKPNGIHLSHSGRKYGEFDPQFGCVVEDYAHKKRLLRQRGWEELPPEKVSDIRDEPLPQPVARDPNVFAGDSLDEVMAQLPKEQINWRETGNYEQRLKQSENEESAWALKPQ